MSSMPRPRRFLILTGDAGFGHRSAANSIAKALTLQHPQDAAVRVVNPIFEEPVSPLLRDTERDYDRTVTDSPAWYRFTYEISDSRPASALVETTLILALYKSLKQLFDEARPDAILNTTQMFNAPAGAVLRSIKPRPPLYTVVTDLADVHAMWFNSLPDRFFVASEWVRSQAMASKIAPQRVCISGIPVDPEFGSERAAKPELRRRLGLEPHLPTLLVVGSRRVSGILDHLEALDGLAQPFQVAVIAGGDQSLYEKAARRLWHFPILVENFVTNMAEWMLCADLLVTKAGGLILSEGLAAGLPILMIDYLPGQEEGNVRFILEHQAGAMVKTPGQFRWRVEAWLRNNQAGLKAIASTARRLGRPDAALVVADALWQAVEHGAPLETPRMRVWNTI